eukprot:scaffold447_cov307-Pinguiococcus_pyrenoidosus.AAC.19
MPSRNGKEITARPAKARPSLSESDFRSDSLWKYSSASFSRVKTGLSSSGGPKAKVFVGSRDTFSTRLGAKARWKARHDARSDSSKRVRSILD